MYVYHEKYIDKIYRFYVKVYIIFMILYNFIYIELLLIMIFLFII